jgi:membrane fusion protein (multidrug efflux system)
MMKRMLLMVVVMTVIIGGLGFVKFQQIQAAIAQGASFQMPPEAVTTIVVQQTEWPETLSAIGSVAAVQGVVVSADLSGTVERVAFDSGKAVRQGEVLVELDTRQERAQLAAAEAQRELARTNFDRMQGLLKDNVISRAEYDSATADDKQSEARAGEIRAAIQRKRITAPFSGILGIRQVNVGQYLSSGDPIVQLQSLNPIYVNFDVPQQAISEMRTGREVVITTGQIAGVKFSGRINAIDSVVNSGTRNIQVQATLANPEGHLRPGMFVEAEVNLGAGRPLIAVPATAISYAPYGDSVYVVTSLKGPNGEAYRGVRQQFVKLEGARGDQVGVTSGVKPGEEIVTSGVFKLRNGAAVLVNNKVQPGNNPSPTPENN